ncbi:MAG TPA: PAS domain S-box protein [Azospirillum sp.]|nr:PAS domain S-box protein [Azospirillum sp.]
MSGENSCSPCAPAPDLLRASLRHQRALAHFGTRALTEENLSALLQQAATCAAEGTGIERAKVIRYRPESDDLLVVAGVGWHTGVVGHTVLPNDPNTPTGRALATRRPVTVANLRAPGDLHPSRLLVEHGVASALNVPIGTETPVWGVLEVDGSAPRSFHETEVLYLQGLANLLGAAIQRAKAEEQARIEHAQLEAVLRQLPSGVAIAEAPSGRLLMHNDKAIELLGHPMREAENYRDYARHGARHPDGTPYGPDEYPIVRAATRGETVDQEPMIYQRGNGRITYLLVSAAPVRDAAGRIVQAVSTFSDQDERLRMEAELRATRDRLAMALESTTDCVTVVDRNWRILYQNARAKELVSGGRDVIGVVFWEAYPGVIGTVFEERYRTSMAEERPDAFEAFYETLEIWLEVHVYPSQDLLTFFFRDVTRQRREREALAANEARYRAAFEQAGVGICEIGLDGRYLRVNDRFCAITGYARDELLCMRFQDITHPDDLERDTDNLRAVRANELSSCSLEKRYLRKDGAVLWVNLTMAVVRTSDGGADYFITVIEDISARKQAEADREELLRQKDLLMREINHRIKNSLQMVALLVHMQAADIGNEEARVRFQETATRIATVALVHERLYQASGLEEVESGPYLRDLCADISAALGLDDGRLIVEVVDVVLPADTAISLGLIVNELVTNAAKYAYPTGVPGPIYVSLGRTDDSRLRLMVSDEGVGLPPGFDPETSTGLGMRVLVALTQKVEGELLVADQGTGACFQVLMRG